MVGQGGVVGIIEVLQVKVFFSLLDPFVRQSDRLGFQVDLVILLFLQFLNKTVRLLVELGRPRPGTGNNQGRPRFVN